MLTSDLGPGLATLETLVHQQVWESGAKWETINSLSVCSRIFCLQVCCGLNVTHWCVVGAITAYEAFSCATLAVCSGLKRRIGGVLVGGGRGWEPSTKQHTPSLLHQCVTSSFHSIRQCAPFFVLSSTRWHTLSLLYPTKRHTPSLYFSTRWKTSPCGAHFSLTHSSAHHLKCVGTLKWLWWLSALLENQTWSFPYILCKLLYTSNWNGTQTSMRAGTRNIMKMRPYIVGVYCWGLSVEAGVHCMTS